MESGAKWAEKNGLLDQTLDNYVTHIYTDKAEMLRNAGKLSRATSMKDKSGFSVHRLLATFAEAEKAGLHPVYNIPTLVGAWYQSMNRALTNRTFMTQVRGMVAKDGKPLVPSEVVETPETKLTGKANNTQKKLGHQLARKKGLIDGEADAGFKALKMKVTGKESMKDMTAEEANAVIVELGGKPVTKRAKGQKIDDPVISTKRIPGYVNIHSPEMAGAANFLSSGDIWVHPQFAAAMKAVAGKRGSDTFGYSQYVQLRNGVKRLVMFNPLIHGWNLTSDFFDEMNFNIMKTLSGVFKGASLKDLNAAGFETRDDLHIHMAKHGVGVSVAKAAASELYESMQGLFPEQTTSWEKWGKHPLRSVKELSDKVLWENIAAHIQEIMYLRVRHRGMLKGMSEDSASMAAADFVNSNLGTLTRVMFTPAQSESLNFLLFARNWTISNLRLLTGALGIRHMRGIPRFLRHTGLTKQESQFLQVEYTKHLIKGVVALLTFANILNLFFTGLEYDEEEEDFIKRFKWNMEDAKFTWQNEKGHELDVDLGFRDKKGREVFIVPPLFRYIRDIVSWFSGDDKITDIAWNKAEPLLKLGIETWTNNVRFTGQPLIHPGATDLEGALDWGEYAIRNITPASQLVPRRGQVRGWVEELAPLLGTWVTHGLTGGDAAKKLMEFKVRKGYVDDKIDLKINELIQDGDLSGAIDKMVKEKRYGDGNAIKGRLTQYNYKLFRTWSMLTNQDKVEFLGTLDGEEKKMFMDTIGKRQ